MSGGFTGLAAVALQIGSATLKQGHTLEVWQRDDTVNVVLMHKSGKAFALRLNRNGTVEQAQWFVGGRRIEPTELDLLQIQGSIGAALQEAQAQKFGGPNTEAAEPEKRGPDPKCPTCAGAGITLLLHVDYPDGQENKALWSSGMECTDPVCLLVNGRPTQFLMELCKCSYRTH